VLPSFREYTIKFYCGYRPKGIQDRVRIYRPKGIQDRVRIYRPRPKGIQDRVRIFPSLPRTVQVSMQLNANGSNEDKVTIQLI